MVGIVSRFRLAAFGLAMVVALAFLSPAAVAGMVSTEAVAGAGSADSTPDSAAARAAIRAGLVQMGLAPAEAEARVAALSDAELLALAGPVANAPAGGDDDWINWYLVPEILASLVFIIVIVSA